MLDHASSALTTQSFRITGRVQRVWYRASMCAQAQALEVQGWVRNRSDGSVEARCQGTAAQLETLHRWCLVGPPNARVEAVQVQALPAPQAPLGAFRQVESE
jgi:acylphosphatase